MEDRIKLEIEKGVDNKKQVGVSVNIDITNGEGSKLSGSVLLIPKCDSYKILQKEVTQIKEELDSLLERSKRLFETEAGKEGPEMNENMSAKEIWDILSMIKNPEILSEEFNSMSHQKRLEVADYVLANCNVFSGPGAIFSMRYNSEEAVLE
jgi:hypothetical protein